MEFRATQSTCPAVYSAQLGAENSAPATFAGLLHTPPLRIVHCRLPLVAVAAQITLPARSLVHLGLELTGPARLFHVPHVVPLNRFTMMADLPLRTAHATWLPETWAQDGVPIPVPVPVGVKLPQLAHAAGPSASQTGKSSRHNTVRFIWIPPK